MVTSPDKLIVLLHGVGSNGDNMMPIAKLWRKTMPTAVFAAPDAPEAFPQGQGRQWFSLAGITRENRPDRVLAARESFDRTLRSIIDQRGFRDRVGDVVLVGFSQGSIMTLDAVASGRWPVAAAVAYSGRLAIRDPFSPALATAVLLTHGLIDPVVPPEESTSAATRLKAAGMNVMLELFPGVGHIITPAALTLGERFITTAKP